jgi:hypothetical protein
MLLQLPGTERTTIIPLMSTYSTYTPSHLPINTAFFLSSHSFGTTTLPFTFSHIDEPLLPLFITALLESTSPIAHRTVIHLTLQPSVHTRPITVHSSSEPLLHCIEADLAAQ